MQIYLYLREDQRNRHREPTGANQKILGGIVVQDEPIAIRPERQERHRRDGGIEGGAEAERYPRHLAEPRYGVVLELAQESRGVEMGDVGRAQHAYQDEGIGGHDAGGPDGPEARLQGGRDVGEEATAGGIGQV